MKAERNVVEVGCVYKDKDRRYAERAADRYLTVTGFTGATGTPSKANCRVTIGGRESKKTMVNPARLADPVRFLLVERPAVEQAQAEPSLVNA